MSTLVQTLGIVLAGVAVILFYVSVPLLGALFGSHSPLTFMIYVGLALTALWLSVIMYVSTGRGGTPE